jgi:hypothetical protein
LQELGLEQVQRVLRQVLLQQRERQVQPLVTLIQQYFL